MNSIFSSKFVRLIKALTEEEVKSFEIWLSSPWCNTNKNIIRLFDVLKKHAPQFDSEKLTKEKLFKKILPNGKFSDRRMNNLLSEGYLVLEQFVIFQNLKNNQHLRKDILTQEFQKRDLEDWFFKNVRKQVSYLEEKEPKEWEDYLDLLRLNRRMYHNPNSTIIWRQGTSTIQKINESVDIVYLLEKALTINEMLFRNRLVKDGNYEIENELSKWKKASEGVKHPSIDLYQLRFSYTNQNMLENYEKIKSLFFEKYMDLNEMEQKVHLKSLLNDNALLGRMGLIDYTSNLPIYKFGLRTNLLMQNEKLSRAAYVTIVSSSNTKGDFEFTEHFVETYSKNLEENIQEDAVQMAKAHTAYRKGNLQESIDILLQHQFRNTYFQIVTRIMTVQVYFDLFLESDSYQSFLFNYFDSFEKWIQREKHRSTAQKKSYLQFIQICRLLAKNFIEADFSKERVERIFEGNLNVQALTWLKKRKDKVIEFRTGMNNKLI